MSSPEELAWRRWRPFRKAVAKRDRLIRELNETNERMAALRDELPQAEQTDREAYAEALAAGRDEPERAAAALVDELERLQRRVDACQLAIAASEGEIGQLRAKNGPGWLREAQAESADAREAYERILGEEEQARERLEQEAALVAFVAGSPTSLRLAASLIVRTPDVEGHSQSVPASGVLQARRDALSDLELDVLRTR